MIRPLLMVALLWSQVPASSIDRQAPTDHPPAPPTVQEHLQVRAELEDLRLERAQLLRRVAELRGLVEYLSGPDVQDLDTRRKALAEALASAGLQRTDDGRVVPLPAKGKDAPK